MTDNTQRRTTAIAVQAIEHHRQRVRFLSTIELVNALEQEQPAGQQGRQKTKTTP